MKINPDEHAMPDIITDAEYQGNSLYGNTYSYGGLSIRAHFAGLAMQGYVSADNIANIGMPVEMIAGWSVNMADALIAELNKEKV